MLLAVGINHKTAPVALREQVAIGPDETVDALRALRQASGVGEAAILSTCNRTELYCDVEPEAITAPVDWLHRFRDFDRGFLEAFLYRHANADAVRHLLRVTAGLDSMILGEPEILGQVKTAYRVAREADTVDKVLDRLFRHSLTCAKRVRSDTSIGKAPVSVAYAAVSAARRLFSTFGDKTVLAIGAGETMELTLRHARGAGIGQLIIANRSIENARHLANRHTGTAIGLDQVPAWLGRADLIFSSTAAPRPIVTAAMMQDAVRGRKRKPVLIVDLAVPRDFDDAIAKMEDIYLYSVDDLSEIVDQGLSSRRLAAEEAGAMVDVQVDDFMAWLRSRDAQRVVRSYRNQHEDVRDQLLERARREIAAGGDPVAILERMANQLTARLLHGPSQQMRAAGERGDEDFLTIARQLLGIKH